MDLKIALLTGDGIGPEVIKQAVKVCNAIAQKFNHKIQWDEGLIGAAAIDATGDPYPEDTHELCLSSDAILFGAIVITKTSTLDKMYIDNNLPVVILQDWDELNDINLVEKLEKWKNIHLKKNYLIKYI